MMEATNQGQADGHYLVHTDGACRGNPGPGGWASIIQVQSGEGLEYEKELSGAVAMTTNNRMEMTAAISAIKSIACTSPSRPVVVVSDSEILVRGASEWLVGWKARGWRKSNRKPVENRDLWQEIDALIQRHTVEWRWTRAHAGCELNERCDRLANREIEALLDRRPNSWSV